MNCLKSVPWFNQGTLFYFIRLKISIFFLQWNGCGTLWKGEMNTSNGRMAET